jgi:hypothetical protein
LEGDVGIEATLSLLMMEHESVELLSLSERWPTFDISIADFYVTFVRQVKRQCWWWLGREPRHQGLNKAKT